VDRTEYLDECHGRPVKHSRTASSIDDVPEALATYCHDYDACWRPVETPDGLPFVSVEAGIVWAVLLVLSIGLLVARLLRA
jgi:hypothetical protein